MKCDFSQGKIPIIELENPMRKLEITQDKVSWFRNFHDSKLKLQTAVRDQS